MSNLPPLEIKIPPKPIHEPEEGETPPVEPVAPRKKGTVGQVFAWTCGSCLVIVLIGVLIIFGMINNWNKSFNQEPPLSAQDQINQPLALAYNEAFTAQQANLPDFMNWGGAQFSAGIPCASNVDSCLMGDTGSTAWLDETRGPSTLKVSDAPRICEEVIAVGKNLGVAEDLAVSEMDYQTMTTAAKARCVASVTSNARSVGFGWWSPSYFMIGDRPDGTPFAIQLDMYRESHGTGNINKDGEYISFVLTTSSVFDSPRPKEDANFVFDWKSGKVQAGAFLDTLSYVRRSNYELSKTDNPSPFSPEIAGWANDNFKKNFKTDAKFEYFKGSDGMVRWFHVKAKDGFDACVSTGTDAELVKENEEDLGITILQSGSDGVDFVGKEIDSPTSTHSIGDYYTGACHN